MNNSADRYNIKIDSYNSRWIVKIYDVCNKLLRDKKILWVKNKIVINR